MSKSFLEGFVVVLVFLSIPSAGRAEDCDAVLVRDYYNRSTDSKTTLSLLKLMDQQHFDQFKQGFSGNVIVPLYGVPVDFGASWDTFKETRDRYINQLNINFSDEEHQTIATSSVPPGARKAWLECKIRSVRGSLFFEIDSLSGDGSEVRITGEYSPQAGGGDGKLNPARPYVLSGDASFEGTPPETWPPNLPSTFTVKRNPKVDFFLTANLTNGQANTLKLPPWTSNRLAAQCKPPPDSDGYCIECEFEINNFIEKVVDSGPVLNFCPSMKPGDHVQAVFESGFKVWFPAPANQFWPEVGLQIQGGDTPKIYTNVWNYSPPQSAQEFLVTIQTEGSDVVPTSGTVLVRVTPDKCVINAGTPCVLSAVPISAHPAKPLLTVKAFSP
jgi:hypothetical protein